MKRVLTWLLLSVLSLGSMIGCSSLGDRGTVDTNAAKNLLAPVIERTDALIQVHPGVLIPQRQAEYDAAKLTAKALPSDTRVAAAQSWLAVSVICETHDFLVEGLYNCEIEPYKSYIRSTELLRKMYAEAFMANGQSVPPTPGLETRPSGLSGLELCPDGRCKRAK